jgi:hypothetical protein
MLGPSFWNLDEEREYWASSWLPANFQAYSNSTQRVGPSHPEVGQAALAATSLLRITLEFSCLAEATSLATIEMDVAEGMERLTAILSLISPSARIVSIKSCS